MILVTGASGFIGREVCRALLAHRCDLVATDLTATAGATYPFAAGDLCDSVWLADLFHAYPIQSVIHLASLRNRESQAHPAEAMRVNIGASLNLIRVASQRVDVRFVYGSSISVYGPKPYARYGAISETEPAAPDNVYGLGKRYVEIAGEQESRSGRLSFVALRMAMVVGAGVVSTASMWRGEIFDRLKSSQPCVIQLPYAKDDRLPLIHATDVAEMLYRLATATRLRYTLYNTPVDQRTCAELAADVTALNPRVSFAFQPAAARGDPESIDGSRFQDEFDYPLPAIRERLRQAI